MARFGETFNISCVYCLKCDYLLALPAFASGLRNCRSVAPIGAVVGEWVGSSEGLGYLMIHANAWNASRFNVCRLTDFSVNFTFCLYFSIDWLLQRVLFGLFNFSLKGKKMKIIIRYFELCNGANAHAS